MFHTYRQIYAKLEYQRMRFIYNRYNFLFVKSHVMIAFEATKTPFELAQVCLREAVFRLPQVSSNTYKRHKPLQFLKKWGLCRYSSSIHTLGEYIGCPLNTIALSQDNLRQSVLYTLRSADRFCGHPTGDLVGQMSGKSTSITVSNSKNLARKMPLPFLLD